MTTDAPAISAADPHPRERMAVLDSEMSYVDTGSGPPVVLLHGNPTSSYLWRNIIPHLSDENRCLAPDLIGMGASGKAPDGGYRFVDHVRYVDAWLEALDLNDVLFVVHDWGSAIGFHWARRHPERVRGIAYMESIVRPRTWADFPGKRGEMFQAMRGPTGEKMVLEENFFVETVLPNSIQRTLSDTEMERYREPYREPGASRLPTLVWPRELPIEGEPADVVAIVEDYGEWLAQSDVPKLFINAEPGAVIVGGARDLCRTWPNQTEITVPGIHFVQEDAPHEIGAAIAEFAQSL